MAHSAKVTATVEAWESDAVETGARHIATLVEQVRAFPDDDVDGACNASASCSRAIAAAVTPEELDLYDDGDGDYPVRGLAGDVGFQKVKFIYVENTHATGQLTLSNTGVSGWSTGPFGDGTIIPPGGYLLVCDPGGPGWAVANGNQLIKFTADEDGTSFKVVVAGVKK